MVAHGGLSRQRVVRRRSIISDHTHIVRCVVITPHAARLQASSNADALAMAKRLIETLSPTARTRTFLASDKTYERFEVEPILALVTVSIEARAI